MPFSLGGYLTVFTVLTFIIFVLGFCATLYRAWQVARRRMTFKNNFAFLVYVIVILFVLVLFGLSWILFYQYIWPGQLAVGKGAYKVVFSVELWLLVVSFGYLISETIRGACIRKSSGN